MFERCPGCQSSYCAIPCDGPDDAEILCLGERPGQDEERLAKAIVGGYNNGNTGHYVLPDQMCFIGQAGREFNENYLLLAGLSRDRVRVGNVVRCGKDQNRKPTAEEVSRCSGYFLKTELSQHRYSILVMMGSTACSIWPKIDLEVDHGIPQYMEAQDCILTDLERSGWVIPMYHPASGLHDTGMMIPMLEDWIKLGRWLDTGEWQWPEDEYASPDYRLCQTRSAVLDYFKDYGPGLFDCPVWFAGADTESDSGVPYSAQVSIKPGTGIMCLLENQESVRELADNLQPFELVFHHAPADLAVFGSFAGALPYQDTMQQAYHFGHLPQGLKALSYRQFGVRMQSWEDLVTGPSKDKLIDWIYQGILIEQDRPDLTKDSVRRVYKNGKVKVTPAVFKPNQTEKHLQHVLKHIDKPDYDPWQYLDERKVDVLDLEGVPLIGPVPRLSIRHAKLEDQVKYACRDADMALRNALRFEEMRREIVAEGGEWSVPEEDWDK